MNKNNIYADLHVHSDASDGLLSPEDLVMSARKSGLRVLAVTDHDTVAGIKPAKVAAADVGIKLVPGIELSCGWKNQDTSVHVVGLFIDENDAELNEILNQQKKNRYARAKKMLDKLEGLGFPMSELRDKFANSPEIVIGRPHVAKFLLDKGHVSDRQAAFTRFLGRGCPAYVSKDHLDPEKAIKIIHDAGGVAVVAHPGLISKWDEIWAIIGDLPWDGLETYYFGHSPSQVKKFEKIVAEKQWLSSGGSDYHGEYGKHINSLGRYGLVEEQFVSLIEKCRERGIDV